MNVFYEVRDMLGENAKLLRRDPEQVFYTLTDANDRY